MKWSTVGTVALLFAVALAVVPELLPTGPTTSLDASGLLASGRFPLALGVIFLGGLLTSLTPCVYPLIPITVSVFGAKQAESRGKAVVLTSASVVGMGVVFSALGVVAALSGTVFGSVLGSNWFAFGLAAFLLVLASSMFGAFEMALPSGLATKLNTVGGAGLFGAFLMGSVSGFLAAPCTGPVLTGVLAYVSKTQDPYVGGVLLFTYALGIGVPFFLIGVFAMRLMKSGEWMEWVKSVFGIALVALAAGYVRDASPALRDGVAAVGAAIGRVPGIAIASGLVFAGVLAGAIHLSFHGTAAQKALKAAGVVAVVVAVLLRSSAGEVKVAPVAGSQPLAWATTFKAEVTHSVEPFDALLRQAQADCKPVMIDFFADWCAACKELDKKTYTAPEVASESQRFVNIKVDGTEDDEVLTEIYARYGVTGLPTVAFIDPMGQVLDSPRVTGFMPPDRFLGEMKKVRVTTCSRTQ